MRVHHSIFHISELKHCRVDEDNLSKVATSRVLVLIANRPELAMAEILVHIASYNDKNKRFEYFVHWKNIPEEENSWERLEALW